MTLTPVLFGSDFTSQPLLDLEEEVLPGLLPTQQQVDLCYHQDDHADRGETLIAEAPRKLASSE